MAVPTPAAAPVPDPDSGASDDEAGAAGPPGWFSVIIHFDKMLFSVLYHAYVIQMSNHNYCCFCFVQFHQLRQFPLLLQPLFLTPVQLFPLLLDVSISLLFIFGEIIFFNSCMFTFHAIMWDSNVKYYYCYNHDDHHYYIVLNCYSCII